MSSTPPVEPDRTFVPINDAPDTVQKRDQRPLSTGSHYESIAVHDPKAASKPLILPPPSMNAEPTASYAPPPEESLLPWFEQLAHGGVVWKQGNPCPLSAIPQTLKIDDVMRICHLILQIDPVQKEPELAAHITRTFALLLDHLAALSLPPTPRKLARQAEEIFTATVRQILMAPHASTWQTCVIACIARWEASIEFLIPHDIQSLIIKTRQPLPSDLPTNLAKYACDGFTISETHGQLYSIEYLAQRTGKSPQDILEHLPSDFWIENFEIDIIGQSNDAIANFLEQLPRYVSTPMAFLLAYAPGSTHTRLESIVHGMFNAITSSNYASIYRNGAARILSALFRLAPNDDAADAIASTFLNYIQKNPALLTKYSECFALLVENIRSPDLLLMAVQCITPSIACRDPILRETIFRMERSGTRFHKEILASTALGPAHITTQSPSETWGIWKTSLMASTSKHRLITEKEISNVGKPTFLNVAEVFTRAIELAHTLEFDVVPNKKGILDPDTIAFVAAVMSPREGNFGDFAMALNKANIPIKPDPYASAFVHYLADMVVIPTSVTHMPSESAPNPRDCALALAEGRTTLKQPAKKSNNGYNLLTFGSAALRFERHCHGIAQKITTIPTHNQFHPILSARGKIPVSMWTDPITGFSFQEIDTDNFRLREARSLGHCGGATPKDRERKHCAQYAVRKDDLSIATFDVSIEKAEVKAIDEHIRRGAGRSCEIPFGDRVLRVKDIGGPGDTKRIPTEVTAAWERFAQFLHEQAMIPENRLGERPPPLTPLGDDPVTSKCGYDYKKPSERQRVFEMVCQHPDLKGAADLLLFRLMFKEAKTPEQWVFGDKK